jgi:hypothetical protein
MKPSTEKKLIGRAEPLSFPQIGVDSLHARIDTGAKTSAIWVSSTRIVDGKLAVVFFGPSSEHYDGKEYYFDWFERSVVASSNGQTEERYKVKLLVVLKGKKIRARFTLTDRSTQVYPVLVGRNILRGKFIVDVQRGKPLRDVEKERSSKLQSLLSEEEAS